MKHFCVIGYPIKHSLSPRIHNAWFKKKGINALYEAVEVKPENFAHFMKSFCEEFLAANVTIPHKQAVMKYLDWVSPEAKKIGAVNVIVNRNGKLYGYNTDVFGAMEALERAGKIRAFKGKDAVVLGAGGAARAVVHGLVKAGAHVTVLNRTVAHAKKLSHELGAAAFGALADFEPSECDILVNTTSVGMWPKVKDSPLPDFKKSAKKMIVMDIIYRPKITKLLRAAKSAGCKIITGDHMFLAQAKKSFEYFSA